MTVDTPLALIGGGYRTVSFLSQHPRLLEYGVAVYERSNHFGAGAFQDYDCTSTSVANRFFSGVAREVLDRCERRDWILDLSREDSTPMPLHEVSQALQSLGDAVAMHPRASVHTGESVVELSVEEDHVRLKTEAGRVARAAHVIIATGREERRHEDLRTWETKTVLSSELLSRRRSERSKRTIETTDGPIVIAGSSHSAASALIRLLKFRAQCGRPDLEIRVLRRSGIRLHYSSLEQALAQRNVLHESDIDPILDVCPDTLQVNRDSGLRGASRTLFRTLMAGELPNTRLIASDSLAQASDLLDDASLIVQALGYRGRAPAIQLANDIRRETSSEGRLFNLPDGTAIIEGRPQPRVSVLRVEPTPFPLRDHALYGQGLYQRLTAKLEAELGEPR